MITNWEQEWGSKILSSHGTSAARGVCIIYNYRKIKVKKYDCDDEGRLIVALIEAENTEYNIVNLYAPNVNSVEFFQKVTTAIEWGEGPHTIIGGDFNTVLDPCLDRNNGGAHDASSKFLNDYLEESDYVDIWRCRNPETKRYTWHRGSNTDNWQASRIDYFLINQGLANNTQEVYIQKGFASDHAGVFLEVDNPQVDRGPGIWRFNNKLLFNAEFVDAMRESIKIAQLCSLEGMEKWSHIKGAICEEAQKLSRFHASQEKLLLNDLRILKTELNDNLAHMIEKKENDSAVNEAQVTADALSLVETRILELENKEVEAAIFRSRSQWAAEGERSTKYFFSLEKRHYYNKTMFSVFDSQGTLHTEQRNILKEQERFYQVLYDSEQNSKFELINTTGIVVPDSEYAQLTADLSINEMQNALSDMKNGKAPGCDGLTVDFYKYFWEDLKVPLKEMYDAALAKGILPESTRKGIISLIPKKNKDVRYIKNLRPLTLLNIDYKVLAKLLAIRLKRTLPYIIGDQQTGFMKGRDIHTNIRKTMDIIADVNRKKTACLIITIDFIKCFDYIEFSGLFGALNYFNFPKRFISWVQVFFNKFLFCTQNAGYHSNFHIKKRGINQGCPISPFIFLACGEILAHLLIYNPHVKGVRLGQSDVMHVISQFADDATLFLEATQENLQEVIKSLTLLERNTGLQISYEKTTIYRVGSLRHSDASFYSEKPIQWSDGDIDMLGITIRNAEHQDVSTYDRIIEKMQNISQTWYHRRLTLMGKVLLINTLMASLFVYSMAVLPGLTTNQLNKITQIIHDFLWGKGVRAKIPMKVLIRKKFEGGLKLVNFSSKLDSLHFKWIKILENSKCMQEYVYDLIIPKLSFCLWDCNLSAQDAELHVVTHSFLSDLFIAWCRIHHHKPQTAVDVKGQIIWGNSWIRCRGTILTPPLEVWNQGIKTIEDLLDEEECGWLTWENFKLKFPNSISWLEFYQIIRSIPREWITILGQGRYLDAHKLLTAKDIIDHKKPTGLIYNEVINNFYDDVHFQNYANKWAQYLNCDIPMDKYQKYFKRVYSVTTITKLRDFQYRLNLNKVYPNYILKKWKVVDCELCEFCQSKVQTVMHMLIECKYVQWVWRALQGMFVMSNLCWEQENLIFNTIHENPKHLVNLLALILKQYIYYCKCQGIRPNIRTYREKVVYWYRMELYNTHMDHKQVHKLTNKWQCIEIFLNQYGVELKKCNIC